jgi:simple sugar transport system substrate-binding protein
LIEGNSEGDVSKESALMDRYVSAGVDAILISALSIDGSVRAIQRAQEAGIPVICYNTCINEADQKKYVTAFVGGDHVDVGIKQGTAVADYLKSAGIKEGKIGILNCEFVEACKQRLAGFTKAMDEHFPAYEILTNQEGAIADRAVTTATQMINAHPEMNVIYAEAGGGTLGAIRAVRQAGMEGKIAVIGADQFKELADELVKNDVLKANVDLAGSKYGEGAIKVAIELLNGNKPAERFIPVAADFYRTPEEAKAWLETHPDGLP